MNTELIFNYTPVNSRLCTAGLLNAEQLAMLGEHGYQVVINLLPLETDYAIQEEADIIKAQGLNYIYIPVDFSSPQHADYEQFAQALQTNKQQKIMAHCAANYRVSAFYALYAVQYLGWNQQQALQFIADRWDLSEYPVWQSFVHEQLEAMV